MTSSRMLPIQEPHTMHAVAQDFLRRQGLTGALLIVIGSMLGFDRQDRNAAAAMNRIENREHALFVKQASVQVQQFGLVLEAHVRETNEHNHEVLQVLRAVCVNAAITPDERSRCVAR